MVRPRRREPEGASVFTRHRDRRVHWLRAMSDLIECDGCGRSFTTDYGAAEMLAAIKGPCPSCGGSFRLAPNAEPSIAPVKPAQRPTAPR